MNAFSKSIIFALICTIVYIVFHLLSPSCKNDIVESLTSPDGMYTAWLFSRNCGATTDFNTQISIKETKNGEPSLSGNIYISDMNAFEKGVKMTWKNNNLELLFLNKRHNQVFKKEKKIKLDEYINIIYYK